MEQILTAMEIQKSPLTQIWIIWITFIFLASIAFLKHKEARRALVIFVATLFSFYIIWTMSGNVHLFGLAHIVIWVPLAIYLWTRLLSKRARKHDGESRTSQYRTFGYRAFFTWALLLFATIIVSLIFDLRDVAFVITGQK